MSHHHMAFNFHDKMFFSYYSPLTLNNSTLSIVIDFQMIEDGDIGNTTAIAVETIGLVGRSTDGKLALEKFGVHLFSFCCIVNCEIVFAFYQCRR